MIQIPFISSSVRYQAPSNDNTHAYPEESLVLTSFFCSDASMNQFDAR